MLDLILAMVLQRQPPHREHETEDTRFTDLADLHCEVRVLAWRLRWLLLPPPPLLLLPPSARVCCGAACWSVVSPRFVKLGCCVARGSKWLIATKSLPTHARACHPNPRLTLLLLLLVLLGAVLLFGPFRCARSGQESTATRPASCSERGLYL